MSLETHSTKRHRVYHRMFDHEEAQRLRGEGWAYAKLAEHFGVTDKAVRRVCDPVVRDRMERKANEFLRRKRQPCIGGCGRLVWAHMKERSGYCQSCFQRQRARQNVREGELYCARCEQWKPDDEFPRDPSRPNSARRGRRSECRQCQTDRRREHRHQRPDLEHNNYARVQERRRKKKMARYIVFQPNGNGYVEVARAEAGSPAHAIEQVVKEAGEYIAVPEGRFKIMRVAPVQAFKVVATETTDD